MTCSIANVRPTPENAPRFAARTGRGSAAEQEIPLPPTSRQIGSARPVGVTLLALTLLLSRTTAMADDALIAVASNFAEVMETLERAFESEHGHGLEITIGATGKLYAQILHGAPFDALLAADQKWPERLIRNGHAVAGSRFTYAVGQLALWSADPARIANDGRRALEGDDVRSLAIANPDLAPYGAAAVETLTALGLYERLRKRLIIGENVGQVHAMVATGNAQLGFVALPYVTSRRNPAPGSLWTVPETLHAPIRQDAVLLGHGEGNVAAREFLGFLQRPEAKALIRTFGYRIE